MKAKAFVIAGEFDIILPPRSSRPVADEIPNEWNARVDAFWREVDARD